MSQTISTLLAAMLSICGSLAIADAESHVRMQGVYQLTETATGARQAIVVQRTTTDNVFHMSAQTEAELALSKGCIDGDQTSIGDMRLMKTGRILYGDMFAISIANEQTSAVLMARRSDFGFKLFCTNGQDSGLMLVVYSGASSMTKKRIADLDVFLSDMPVEEATRKVTAGIFGAEERNYASIQATEEILKARQHPEIFKDARDRLEEQVRLEDAQYNEWRKMADQIAE